MKINAVSSVRHANVFFRANNTKKNEEGGVQNNNGDGFPSVQKPIIEQIYAFEQLDCDSNYEKATLKETGEGFSGIVKGKINGTDVSYTYRNGLIKAKQEGKLKKEFKRQADGRIYSVIETFKQEGDEDYYKKWTRYSFEDENNVEFVQIEYSDGTRFFTHYDMGIPTRMAKYNKDGTCTLLMGE